MTWGGLNPALTSWRNGLIARFPNRGTQQDGARADAAHGSTSQHQPDPDGTTDAYDSDVNNLGSSTPAGTSVERQIVDALNADFLADDRAQLVISNRRIANRDVMGGAWRPYGGASPHIEHTHYESKQSRERDGRPWSYARTDALLRRLGLVVDQSDINKIADAVAAKLAPKLDQAISAWDDQFGRGENRVSAGDVLIETRNNVRQLVAALPDDEPTDPPVDPEV